MYLKRKIDKYLEDWGNQPHRKPLIIKGARQIGKTESVRHFAAGRYANFIEINFSERPDFKNITAQGYDVASVIRNISYVDNSFKLEPGKTLIFFDELQDFPEISTALKFFNQDGRYDVICSRSMLGLNYHKIESNSVGNKIDYEMFSFDFEEFLWAKGYENDTIEELYGYLTKILPIPELLHNKMMTLYRDFCILGGMPEVVSKYVSTDSFQDVLSIQKQLILDYKEDIRKYVTGLDQTRILNVFRRVPVQLAQENKKFQITKIASGAKTRDYWGCVEWLLDAGVINICYCLNFPELPLKGNIDPSKYKLYMADTGLLVGMLDPHVQANLKSNTALGTYKGALYENAAGEALRKSGAQLYYYKRQDSTLEADFFLRSLTHLVPIEVKSGDNQSKSLRTLIQSDKYSDISWGIKLMDGNIGWINQILSLPIYYGFLLNRFLTESDSIPKK
ncbi:MAG: ATP-binding protein [Bacteroidales bacterium]|nr:ATP-binding protein [Bacteroidales bacterium]